MNCPHCKHEIPPRTTVFRCPGCHRPLFQRETHDAKVIRRTGSRRIRREGGGPDTPPATTP